MEFDEELFKKSYKIIYGITYFDEEKQKQEKWLVMKYLGLANQKEANLIDKEVCISKSDEQRLDDFTKAALTGILSNPTTLDRTIDAWRKNEASNRFDTNQIISMAVVDLVKKTIAELDK